MWLYVCLYVQAIYRGKQKEEQRKKLRRDKHSASQGLTREEGVKKGSNIGPRQHEGGSSPGGGGELILLLTKTEQCCLLCGSDPLL